MSSTKFKATVFSWLKLSRIQFYPMPWMVYSLGAAAAYSTYQKFNLGAYLWGYIFLFFVELCSVFANEYYDFRTDKLNKNAGPFNGGSRVLVEGRLGFKAVKTAIAVFLFFIFVSGYFLIKISPGIQSSLILSLLLIGFFLGLGYTVPPLKYSYRGLGEIVVAITFSPYLILCGYSFQSGAWRDLFPWVIGMPLLLAIFAAITLSGIPDFQADRSASKRTIAVMLGPRKAAILSACSISIAAVSWILLYYFKILKGLAGLAIFIVILHTAILLSTLFRLIGSGNYNKKMNGIMVSALSYILWFGLIPLLSLIL